MLRWWFRRRDVDDRIDDLIAWKGVKKDDAGVPQKRYETADESLPLEAAKRRERAEAIRRKAARVASTPMPEKKSKPVIHEVKRKQA